MKLFSLIVTILLIFSFKASAARQIIGEEIVNSSSGVKVINVPSAALSAGLIQIDGSGNLTTTAGVSEDPSGLTALGQASWDALDLFKIWDTSASVVKKTSVADFDARYVLQSQFNSLFDTQLATKDTDDLTEGVTNLYFTPLRAQTATISQVITNGVTDKSPSEDAVFDALALKEDLANKGIASGYASLDGAGKVPIAQLPNSIMEFQGVWNATTNSPTLVDATGNTGDVYRVNVAGTQDLGSGSQTFVVGDWVMYDASGIWRLAHSGGDAVNSVNGYSGIVVLNNTDIGLGNVTNVAQIPLSYLDTDGALAANSDVKVASQKATKTYADAKVADAINDGTTTIAPSQNAVFDALALKVSIFTESATVYVDKAGSDLTCLVGRPTLPCLTIQKAIDLATAIPSTFVTPVVIKVRPGRFTEDISFSQQGINLSCISELYRNDSCQLFGNITVNLSGTAGGGNFSASNNAVAVSGIEVFTSGSKHGVVFTGTAFQRLFIGQSFITQTSSNSAFSAVKMDNTGTSGGTKSTITSRDTDWSNNSATNATIEMQAGRMFINGASVDISNSVATRTALLLNGSAAAGPTVYTDGSSITGVVSMSDNTAILQYSNVAQSCGTSACITGPATPNVGYFVGGNNLFTTTNTNVIAGSGVAVLSGGNYCASTGCAIAGTVTQAPLTPLPQGILKPSGLLVSGLTASKLVKTDASKNLISYDLVSGDITAALGFTPENVANKSTDGTFAANSTTLYPSQSAAKTYSDAKVADAINDGTTTIAPSQNAVFDALALKQNLLTNSAGLAAALSDETGTGFSVFSVSPALTGSPTAPTQTANDNSTKIASTAYADAKVADALVNGVTDIAPSQNAVFDAIAAFNAGPTVSAQSSNFTAAFNFIYIVTNAVDVQLPSPVANGIIYIKLTGAADVNLLRAGSEMIDGVAATNILTSTKESVMLVTDGTNWFKL